MSELRDSGKTNSIITVDNYRYFITCSDEDFDDPNKAPFLTELYNLFVTFSLSMKFSFACELITDLSVYKTFAARSNYKAIQQVTIDMLLNSFKDYQGIEREKRDWLLKTAPSYVIIRLINNQSLPLDLLLDPYLLERHRSDSMFDDLLREVQSIKIIRKTEIIAYYRNLVPDSKNMTDEMVLSVAGVTF